MRRVIPYTLPWDDAPVDISFVFEGEKPAGRHGFLQARDGGFVFEDGTAARFWGTNFNSAACFPKHSYSKTVARRLSKFGVNIVRFHQMDAEWSTPNIFQFTKGRRLDDTQSLDPTSLDRLDYLIHCLKQEGIYVYMDLLTYRIFKTGDNVDEAEKLGQEARPYSNFDPRLIELQKMFATQLWTHVNPYTKLAYKDDPVIESTGSALHNKQRNLRGQPFTINNASHRFELHRALRSNLFFHATFIFASTSLTCWRNRRSLANFFGKRLS